MNDFSLSQRFAQFILLCLLMLGGGNASAQKDPLLSFSIEGLSEGDTIYLANYYGNKMYYADTASVGKKGHFDFVSPTPDKGGKYGLVLPGNAFVEFILTGEAVSMTADAADLPGSVEAVSYTHLTLPTKA